VDEVDRFTATLEHPLEEGVERLRTAILASDPDITKSVK
jgi:hypothetical protein